MFVTSLLHPLGSTWALTLFYTPEMLQQAGSLSSLVHGPHTITGGGGGTYGEVGQYLHDSTGRGYMPPSYMPIRDSLDRANKKAGWVRQTFSFISNIGRI